MAPTAPSAKRGASSSAGVSSIWADVEEVRPYVIVADIGKGSFATVYKGYHEVSS